MKAVNGSPAPTIWCLDNSQARVAGKRRSYQQTSRDSNVAAAQYLRMSTEHQQYSLENQAGAIREYAKANGFSIVNTYSDSAKSGLTLKGRHALCSLLRDITQGNQLYKAVLVYDVSRWGRFQDDDEAACYEFLCRSAGIDVRYCAETFSNDGSLASTLLKNLKRAMASEFSRELGERVFAAKSAVASSGFWAGGRAPFGLARYLISADRTRDQCLKPGERKNLRTDHVKLVPGREQDVRCVREMFRMASSEQMKWTEIARELNRRGLLHGKKPWTGDSVLMILTNPLYAGHNIWGKTAQKFAGSTVRIPRESWVDVKNAFEPIINPSDFDHLQASIRRMQDVRRWTQDKILKHMAQLLEHEGRLSMRLLDKSVQMPSSRTVRYRLGYRRALELLGYNTPDRFKAANSALYRQHFCDRIIDRIVMASQGRVTRMPSSWGNTRPRICVDNHFVVEVFVVPSIVIKSGNIRWPLRATRKETRRAVLLCRLNRSNRGLHSMYFIPEFCLLRPFHRVKAKDAFFTRAARLPNPEAFLNVWTKFLPSKHS